MILEHPRFPRQPRAGGMMRPSHRLNPTTAPYLQQQLRTATLHNSQHAVSLCIADNFEYIIYRLFQQQHPSVVAQLRNHSARRRSRRTQATQAHPAVLASLESLDRPVCSQRIHTISFRIRCRSQWNKLRWRGDRPCPGQRAGGGMALDVEFLHTWPGTSKSQAQEP
jgi:hypothetical protein